MRLFILDHMPIDIRVAFIQLQLLLCFWKLMFNCLTQLLCLLAPPPRLLIFGSPEASFQTAEKGQYFQISVKSVKFIFWCGFAWRAVYSSRGAMIGGGRWIIFSPRSRYKKYADRGHKVFHYLLPLFYVRAMIFLNNYKLYCYRKRPIISQYELRSKIFILPR